MSNIKSDLDKGYVFLSWYFDEPIKSADELTEEQFLSFVWDFQCLFETVGSALHDTDEKKGILENKLALARALVLQNSGG